MICLQISNFEWVDTPKIGRFANNQHLGSPPAKGGFFYAREEGDMADLNKVSEVLIIGYSIISLKFAVWNNHVKPNGTK